MKLHKVEEKFFVAGQIFPSDIKSLKEQGFQTIVCNRPNGEEEDQPFYAEIEKTCNENDIKCFFIPISPGEIDPGKVFELNSIIQEEKKTLAYCRTGNRSITQWAFANAKVVNTPLTLIVSKNCLLNRACLNVVELRDLSDGKPQNSDQNL